MVQYSVFTSGPVHSINKRNLAEAKKWVEARTGRPLRGYTSRWYQPQKGGDWYWQVFNSKGKLVTGARLHTDLTRMPRNFQ